MKTGAIKGIVKVLCGEYSPEPAEVIFSAQAPTPPKFKITYRIDDDMVGESLGDGDMVPEPREQVELFLTVENTGKGEARDVRVELGSEEVSLIKGNARIGDLPPGASTEAKLVFAV